MSLKLIFGFPVDERFLYSKQLYYSIRKFCHNPLVLFSSNRGIGYSYQRLKKIPSKREYRYHLINHRFLFDLIEEIKDLDYDYFVKLDSDCLFANYGFEQLFTEKFDFLDSVDEFDNQYQWFHTKFFLENIELYHRFLSSLKLARKDSRVSGCLGALQIYSKRAMDFIAGNLSVIEGYPEYRKMEQKFSCFDEIFLSNLLKDAGFKYRMIYLHKKTDYSSLCVRWRPPISRSEVAAIESSNLYILYHPLKRTLRDQARRVLLKKIGYRYSLKEIPDIAHAGICFLREKYKKLNWKIRVR